MSKAGAENLKSRLNQMMADIKKLEECNKNLKKIIELLNKN